MENTNKQKQTNIKQEPDEKIGYIDAFKNAFHRLWNNRFLWFWGIFLPSGFSIGLNFNYNANDSDFSKLTGDDEKFQAVAENFIASYWQWLMTGVVLLVILMIAFWVLSAVSRRGVIRILDQLQNKEEPPDFKFSDVWTEGKQKYFRIIKLDIALTILVLAVFVALAIPIGFMFATQRPIAGGFLALAGLLIFIPFVFLTIYIKNMSVVFISVIQIGIIRSIEKAYNLVAANLKEALKFFLISLLLSLAKMVVVVGCIFAIGFVAAIIAVVIKLSMENFVNPVSLTLGGVVLTIFLLAMILVHAFFALWQQDLWLWWTKKIGGLKSDAAVEKKPEIIPAIKNTEPAVGAES